MIIVNLGNYRGKRFTNSGDKYGFILSEKLLPDGTMATIKRKIDGYNWVVLDDNAYYPLDLLTPLSKTNCILRKL